MSDSHEWLVHGERLVDDTPHVRVSLADVEIPGHARFTQYVFRMRRVAVTVGLDDRGERVLLMRRHRFIVNRWVWELPGGYVDDGEDPAAAAGREVEEETGWRPVVALAIEAGVPRNALTQRHTDLKAEFHQRIKEGGGNNEDEARLRAANAKLRKSLSARGKELAQARADIRALVRAANRLTTENQQLRDAQSRHGRGSVVVPFPGATLPRPRG